MPIHGCLSVYIHIKKTKFFKTWQDPLYRFYINVDTLDQVLHFTYLDSTMHQNCQVRDKEKLLIDCAKRSSLKVHKTLSRGTEIIIRQNLCLYPFAACPVPTNVCEA